jgi:hypothetical protein
MEFNEWSGVFPSLQAFHWWPLLLPELQKLILALLSIRDERSAACTCRMLRDWLCTPAAYARQLPRTLRLHPLTYDEDLRLVLRTWVTGTCALCPTPEAAQAKRRYSKRIADILVCRACAMTPRDGGWRLWTPRDAMAHFALSAKELRTVREYNFFSRLGRSPGMVRAYWGRALEDVALRKYGSWELIAAEVNCRKARARLKAAKQTLATMEKIVAQSKKEEESDDDEL